MTKWTISIASASLVLSVGAGALAYAQQSSAAERLQAATATDPNALQKRLESVGTLLEKSSGTRQIDSSSDPQALETRNKAREAHFKAREAFKAGDYPRTAKLLDEASSLMFKAVRMAAPEQVTADKMKTDYNARAESVKALLSAQQRIASEKSDPKGTETTRNIQKMLGEAEQLAAANKYPEARATVDRAYLLAKAAVGSMRSGDTLVRTLKFANKEEEYHYELDRNDTHQMLIRVLLDDKQKPGGDEMVARFVAKAKELRGQAESTASKGDHVGAIKLLEDSTAELVKAIRGSGIYIPG
jgi:hypothetical protein